MTSAPDIFSPSHIDIFRNRADRDFLLYDFLYERAAGDIRERLACIKRQFQSVLLCGYHTARSFDDIFPDAVALRQVSPEKLSQHTGQYDLIISLGDLHHENDLPGLLIQMRRALKPDGVLMAAFAGGETLHQLRSSLMQAEIAVMGGASPRVFPFADKQQMAALMQRTGFALPVVDSELMQVSYRDIFHLMKDVRGMGESNVLTSRYRLFTPSKLFAEAARIYNETFPDDGGRVLASFEIIFLIGWAPHESQQKPAKRGSGQLSLTEIL